MKSQKKNQDTLLTLVNRVNCQTEKTKQKCDALELLLGRLENKDFYELISVDFHFVKRRLYHHVFYKNLKEHGTTINNNILFAQYYKGAMGNKYFVWPKDPTSVDHLTNQNSTVEKVK